MSISRRRFLTIAGAGIVAAAGGAAVWEELLRDRIEHPSSSRDRVLIAIQLMGGNDGLNTLVPSDGRYHDARPTLAVPEQQLVSLHGTTSWALHPALKPWAVRWARGELAAIDGIGFAGLSRSHFQAMDWWYSAEPNQTATGWIGRWLDATEGSPTNPLRAVAMGGSALAFRARRALSTTLSSPQLFRLLTPPGTSNEAMVDAFKACGGQLHRDPAALATARAAVPATIDAVDQLAKVEATKQASGTSADAIDANGLDDQLQTAAHLIGLELGVRVIGVVQNGYDTHAGQLDHHRDLLEELATSVEHLFTTLAANRHTDRVLVMTWSEFGRRVAENGSGGTDHGAGNVQFLLGTGVRGGKVIGGADLGHLQDDADVRPAIDARSLYASAVGWLGGPTSEVLGKDWDTYDLVH